jgi:ubiquinone biosynthesis protein
MRNAFSIGRRLIQIVVVLLRVYVLPMLRPGKTRQPPEERFRRALQSLGGAWVKAGQALALRFDLLPRSYSTELLKLLNDNQTFDSETVRQIIYEELGSYPEAIFASFDMRPLAAASIAQVHRATTLNGEELAIKVRRPRVREQFEADFRLLNLLARLIGLFDNFSGASLRSFFHEFERWTREELDFNNEARNGHRLWLRAQGHSIQHSAKIYFEFCTERVLAVEFLDGMSFLDLLDVIKRDDADAILKLSKRGYDVERIAKNFLWATCNQIFLDRVFHADPHPANIFILSGNRIGFVDFGATGQLSRELQQSLATHLVSLYRGDIGRSVDALVRVLVPSQNSDLRQLREDLVVAFETYRYGLDLSEARAREHNAELFVQTMLITRRHRMVMPQALALYYKTIITIDAVLHEIAPHYDAFADLHSFFVQAVKQRNKRVVPHVPEVLFSIRYKVDQLLNDAKSFGAPLQSIDNSLRSVQTRSTLYGVCSVAFCFGAYLANRDENSLLETSGLSRQWVVYSLLAAAVVLLLFMHRQLRSIPKNLNDV